LNILMAVVSVEIFTVMNPCFEKTVVKLLQY
jgi:hypothetical protein